MTFDHTLMSTRSHSHTTFRLNEIASSVVTLSLSIVLPFLVVLPFLISGASATEASGQDSVTQEPVIQESEDLNSEPNKTRYSSRDYAPAKSGRIGQAGGRTDTLPEAIQGVEVEEKLDAQIPLHLAFKDENGGDVYLRNYFNGERPVILTLVYFSCPRMCNLMLNDLTKSMQKLGWTPGKEFDVLTVSFDPTESPKLARDKKRTYMEYLGVPEATHGWHFLTGERRNIAPLAESVGFGYKWVEDRNEYAHGSSIMICTPDGRVSRYLNGPIFDSQTVKLSLLEAADGKVGSKIEQIVQGFLLYCYTYDSSDESYSLAAFRVMQVGAAGTVILVGGFLLYFWRRERKLSKSSPVTALAGESFSKSNP